MKQSVNLKVPITEVQGQMASQVNSPNTLRVNTYSSQTIQNNNNNKNCRGRKVVHFQTYSMMPVSLWYQNQTKISHTQKSYRPVLLMNTGAKILNKTESNNTLKVSSIQVGFIWGMQKFFNIHKSMWQHINKIKNRMIILIQKKLFKQNSRSIYNKNATESGYKGTYTST